MFAARCGGISETGGFFKQQTPPLESKTFKLAAPTDNDYTLDTVDKAIVDLDDNIGLDLSQAAPQFTSLDTPGIDFNQMARSSPAHCSTESPFSWKKTDSGNYKTKSDSDTLVQTSSVYAAGSSTGVSSPLKKSSSVTPSEEVRKRLQTKACYNTFKIVSLLIISLFISPMVTLMADISCMTTSDYCVPHFEMFLNRFEGSPEQEDAVAMMSWGIHALSEIAMEDPYEQSFVNKILADKMSLPDTIYRMNHLGYCKLERGNPVIEGEDFEEWYEECHSMFAATDTNSVMLSDLCYDMYWQGDSDWDDPEKMVAAYREQLGRGSNRFAQFMARGMSLNLALAILKIVGFCGQLVAIVCALVVAVQVKLCKPGNSTSRILVVSVVCLLLNVTIELVTLISERTYYGQYTRMLVSSKLPFVHHFNFFTLGTIAQVVCICVQFTIVIATCLVVSGKPWVVHMKI